MDWRLDNTQAWCLGCTTQQGWRGSGRNYQHERARKHLDGARSVADRLPIHVDRQWACRLDLDPLGPVDFYCRILHMVAEKQSQGVQEGPRCSMSAKTIDI